MPRMTRRLLLASLALGCAGTAFGETLRCRSVNGNVTCAGSGAVACQTVNGRTTCTSGGIVQEFGGRPAAPPEREVAPPDEDEDNDRSPPPRPRPSHPPARRMSIERQGPAGRLFLEREGTRLRLRTEHQSVELD